MFAFLPAISLDDQVACTRQQWSVCSRQRQRIGTRRDVFIRVNKPHRCCVRMKAKTGDHGSDSSPQIVCFGEMLYDLMSNTADADTNDLSAWTAYAGGAPTNVACALSALGMRVGLISTVGADDAGSTLINLMKERGIDVSAINESKERSTRRIFVRRDLTGERKFVGFDGDNESFADAAYIAPEGVPKSMIEKAAAFVAGTIAVAFDGSGRAFDDLAKSARDAGVLVVVDINWRDRIWAHWDDDSARNRILSALKVADVVKASVEDIEFLYGEELALNALNDPESIRYQIDCSGIFVTAGGDGASCAFMNDEGDVATAYIQAFKPDVGVIDTTGAGDAFLAACLTWYVEQKGFPTDEKGLYNMLKFAARVAGVVVAGDGAIDPLKNRNQVESLAGSFA